MKAFDEVGTRSARGLSAHLAELRAALEQQRQFRLDQLSELAKVAASSPPAANDDVHDQVNEILRAGAARALVEVDDALERMWAGRYGICERCTTPIELERLEILPMSRYCMRCQHGLETRAGSGEPDMRRWRRS
jgi:RNA polymerase-binding transcription factor DksA